VGVSMTNGRWVREQEKLQSEEQHAMFETFRRHAATTGYAVSFLIALSSCSKDPFGSTPKMVANDGPEEICESSADWLPNTGPLEMYLPLPHPDSECPFYRGAWQTFLRAMQPTDAKGSPSILAYPTIDTVFKPKVAHTGPRQILIDQNGNTLFYGIHVNPAFAEFIKTNQLETADQLRAYPNDDVKKNLIFPGGVAEFKSAWQVVDGDLATIQDLTKDYIWTQTTVPTLSQDPVTKVIKEDRTKPRTVTARLLAVHVVFTLPGHPEFIWGSFEHSMGAPDVRAADGKRNVAPTIGGENPTEMDPNNSGNSTVVSADPGLLLYKAGTPANLANHAFPESELMLDVANQKFPTSQATSVYRMFPASKSNTTHPDDAVTSLNHNVEMLFSQMAGALPAGDNRGHYRLVGAQWMDKPSFFVNNIPIQNDGSSPFLTAHMERHGDVYKMVDPVDKPTLIQAIHDDGSDSPLSILAGEDRMSSTAMESFSQGPNSFPNCFTCHNTEAVVANGIPSDPKDATAVKLLDPGLLNVSHVLSQFLLEEHEAGN